LSILNRKKKNDKIGKQESKIKEIKKLLYLDDSEVSSSEDEDNTKKKYKINPEKKSIIFNLQKDTTQVINISFIPQKLIMNYEKFFFNLFEQKNTDNIIKIECSFNIFNINTTNKISSFNNDDINSPLFKPYKFDFQPNKCLKISKSSFVLKDIGIINY
jgi:hypothetical protein